MLINETGRVWLTGFGIASRLLRERLTPGPAEIIAGTLAYMSPEQTGRMNRSIDARSDLYSLGVTLYQLLTGVLPFTAADPLEWVHCHIARQPMAPADRRAVPAPLSAITMRLLAKSAEDRYQTAAGLEADLRRCLSQWLSQRRIDPFPLGVDDVSEQLLIPETLYGREREVDALLNAFDRVATQGVPELVLVSGYSGVGKSSVVNELHKALAPSRGLFAAGKFEQYKRDVPYAPLAQAFQMLVRQILVKSEAEVDPWRQAFREALGPNGQLMVNIIPEIEFVIGKQPPVAELPPQEARSRFQLVLRRFVAAFARPEHPLALFLDDLQWLDTASLEFLERLVADRDVRHVLLIGAYRDNEVSSFHPFMRTLSAIREAGARAQELVLAPLALEDTGRLVAEAMRCATEAADPLARLIQRKSDGNPFFTIQFITELEEEGFLRFDPLTATWQWDVDRIDAKGYTENVVDLMVAKLNRLSGPAQEYLQLFACLGNSAAFEILQTVYGCTHEQLHEQLWEAVKAGLIFRSDTAYQFLHDRVQEAAYLLIPLQTRDRTHLRIGTILIDSTPPERREELLFDIVNQLNLGSRLITDVGERERAAELNLGAGTRAKLSTAYASALRYFHAGRSLLSEEHWARNHGLVFSIESHAAECELHTADMVAAERRLTMLAQRATSHHELAVVTRLQITLYTTLDRSDRAVDVFLDYLRRNGVDWSPRPAIDAVKQEYDRIWTRVGDREIEDLVDLPMIEDTDVLDMLDVFTEIIHPAIFFDENLSTLVVCRLVNLCLEHGNCDASCFGYVWFGMFAGPRFNNYKDGFRFGQLGYDLVETRGLTRYQARTYISFGTLTPWSRHALQGRELVVRAFSVAHQTGDLTFSAYSWHELITNCLMVGDPLSKVQSDAEKGLDFVKAAGFGLVIENLAAQLGFIHSLRGLTSAFGCFDAHDYSESDTEGRLANNPGLALSEFFYWTRKLQARFLAGQHALALEASRRAYPLLWPAASQLETGDFRLFAALAHAAAWNSGSSEEKREHLAAVKDHHRQLEIWALHCPANFETKSALVSAEIARIEGRTLDAESFYEASIRSAQDSGFAHCEGIANECAAQFYLARGFAKIAEVYLREARNSYLRWGAEAKVRQLEESYPEIRYEKASSDTTGVLASTEQLDLTTVIRVSEAISGEIEREKLVAALTRTAIEHAGAERGLLILVLNGEPRIEAEARTDLDEIEFAIRHAPTTTSDLPLSVLHYVLRTQQRVLLDDAAADAVYSTDEYVRRRRSRSVLCLPIVRQAKVVGALYLENNLAPGAFTPDRIAVLELLTSQAAISLETTALYADLQRANSYLTEAQRISKTGSFTWDVQADALNWSDEIRRTFGFDQDVPATMGVILAAVHPSDLPRVEQVLGGDAEGREFDLHFRIRTREGEVRHAHAVGHRIEHITDRAVFVGALQDVTEGKLAEEALNRARAELAHVARVASLNAMTASIAHEVSQPLSGILSNASTCVRLLAADPPNLAGAAETARRTIRDANRASEVIGRLRAMFSKDAPTRALVDLNDAAREVITLCAGELQRSRAVLQTNFADALPLVSADRVQVQQVILNLLLNAADALAGVEDRGRAILIQTRLLADGGVKLEVRDHGTGIDPETVEKLFDAFYSTKDQGMGIGLSISRAIIAAHDGRLWAEANEGPGATFSFQIPRATVDQD